MAAEVAAGAIIIAMALAVRTMVIMIDNGTFDKFVVRLNNYICSRIERLEKDI